MKPRTVLPVILAVVTLTFGVPACASAQSLRGAVALELIAQVDDGTAFAARTGDDRLYVTEQAGRVLAVEPDGGGVSTVLDLSARISAGGEQGLLGLAFSPDGGRLYVHFTNNAGNTRVEEYTLDATGAPTKSTRRQLLAVRQPQVNHNGGQLAFGPDGMLYVGLGDGGGGGDDGAGHAEQGNGQSRDTLLGKILRIDPTPDGTTPYTIPSDNPFAGGEGRPEIWSYGLRNPWRFSFDRETGDLWVADVGQDAWEEIDVAPADEGAGRGTNFGWNVFEARERYRDGEAEDGAWPPLLSLSHERGYCSAIGGYVYRGSRIPDLAGAFVFADYCNGSIRWVRQAENRVQARGSLDVSLDSISSFGEDADGELYVLSQSSGLYRIVPD